MCLRAGLLGHVDTVFVSVQELGQRTSCDSAASYLPSWESCRGVMTVHLKRSPCSVLGAFFSCVLWKKVAFRRFRCSLVWFVFSSLSLSQVPTDFEEEQWPLHQFPTGGLMAI